MVEMIRIMVKMILMVVFLMGMIVIVVIVTVVMMMVLVTDDCDVKMMMIFNNIRNTSVIVSSAFQIWENIRKDKAIGECFDGFQMFKIPNDTQHIVCFK